jgi:hypothetical protein
VPSVVGTAPGAADFIVGRGVTKTSADVAAVTTVAPIVNNGAHVGIKS